MKFIVVFCFLFFFDNHIIFCENFTCNNTEIFDAINTQLNKLTDNEKRLLEFTGIIIHNPNHFPILVKEYCGINLSDIIISKKLVPNYMDRYFIAHYLRNQMLLSIRVYDPKLNLYTPIATPFIFNEYDSYVSSNAQIICEVIYHFISKYFYKLYINYPDQCYFLLNDKRLGLHLDLLVEKLNLEGLKFPLHNQL
jgi:hypothetical protein